MQIHTVSTGKVSVFPTQKYNMFVLPNCPATTGQHTDLLSYTTQQNEVFQAPAASDVQIARVEQRRLTMGKCRYPALS